MPDSKTIPAAPPADDHNNLDNDDNHSEDHNDRPADEVADGTPDISWFRTAVMHWEREVHGPRD